MSTHIKSNRSRTQLYGFLTGFYAMQIKRFFLLLTMTIVTINQAQADTVVDTFKISLGGYTLSRYESSMSLTDKGLGAGISLSPEDTLGMNTEQSVVRLDGNVRFNKEHALTYSWYSISSQGNKAVEEEFDWVDDNGDPITIPVGASVTSSLDYDIIKIGYLWSFHHTDKVELAVGGGFHITSIAIGMTADTTSSGIDTTDVSTTVPLPVLSFALSYHVTPKFSWYLKSEFFALRFNDWEGNYTDSTLGMEYRALKNIGLGIGLGSNALKVSEDTSDYKFIFDNRISGALFYVAAYF